MYLDDPRARGLSIAASPDYCCQDQTCSVRDGLGYCTYLPPRLPSSSRAERMCRENKIKDRLEREQVAPTPSPGWPWGVDSDRSQRLVMQDGCGTSVPPGSCCTTPPVTPINTHSCTHHAFVSRASCTAGVWLVDCTNHRHRIITTTTTTGVLGQFVDLDRPKLSTTV